jgi:Fur family ferric uptake transcriptional regulator
MSNVTDAQKWTGQALERLSDAGYRSGGARREVVTLLGEQPCALTALEIEAALARGARRVSRASVYRILDELERVHMIQRIEAGHGMARYEPVRTGSAHHHHVVCDECGQLQPFSDEGLERAIKRLSARIPHAVTEHEVLLHGACKSCSN